jgi:hypothetical protein
MLMLHPSTANANHLLRPGIEVRPLGLREAPALFDAVRQSRQAISQWEAWCTPITVCPMPSCSCSAIEQWHVHAAYDFNIIDRTNGLVIGSVAVNQVSQLNQMANLGYWIREVIPAWHRGRGRPGGGGLRLFQDRSHPAGDRGPGRQPAQPAGRGEGRGDTQMPGPQSPGLSWRTRDAKVFSLVPADLGRRYRCMSDLSHATIKMPRSNFSSLFCRWTEKDTFRNKFSFLVRKCATRAF